MYHEIERKFLVDDMPDISNCPYSLGERYFLQTNDLFEERVQKTAKGFEYEKRTFISPRERRREKQKITESLFEEFKKKAFKVVIRENYLLSKKNPRISIKKYKGEYRGLVFAEVEFDSLLEADNFMILPWMGTEITDSFLGRDAWLLGLSREKFLEILKEQECKKTGESEDGD